MCWASQFFARKSSSLVAGADTLENLKTETNIIKKKYLSFSSLLTELHVSLLVFLAVVPGQVK